MTYEGFKKRKKKKTRGLKEKSKSEYGKWA